ncbi:unnamed protein product [Adineta steineri]|uniref:Uncharacterized protein n=1 Tax=Adineta steineri TaxID=433720 RepID=A0A820S5D9_9BILA|nr:unnamed protein product [Adineta steineri]
MLDIDGVYNSQNDRIWAVDRSEADTKGGTRQKRKFPQKIMVWLGVCSKGGASSRSQVWQRNVWEQEDLPAGWCNAT